jgi:hypothetical protein
VLLAYEHDDARIFYAVPIFRKMFIYHT